MLTGFPAAQFEAVLRGIRRKLVQVSLSTRLQEWLESFFFFAAWGVVAAAAIVGPVLVWTKVAPPIHFSELPGVIGAIAAVELVAGFATFAPSLVRWPKLRQRNAIVWQLSFTLLFGGVATWLVNDHADRVREPEVFAVAAAFFAITAGSIANIVAGIVIATVIAYVRRRTRQAFPDCVACRELTNVLWYMQFRSHAHSDELGFRHYLVLAIEKVASCLERDLPRRLVAGDPVTTAHLKARAHDAATALRQTKPLILLGGNTEFRAARRRLCLLLAAVATGDWTKVPFASGTSQASAPETGARTRRLRTATRVTSQLVVSGALLALVERFGPADAALRVSIQSVIAVWVIALVTSSLDPRGDKLALVKEIAQFVRLPRRGWSSSLAPPEESTRSDDS